VTQRLAAAANYNQMDYTNRCSLTGYYNSYCTFHMLAQEVSFVFLICLESGNEGYSDYLIVYTNFHMYYNYHYTVTPTIHSSHLLMDYDSGPLAIDSVAFFYVDQVVIADIISGLMENLIVVILIKEDALVIQDNLHYFQLFLLYSITAIDQFSFFILDSSLHLAWVHHQLHVGDLRIHLHNIHQHRLKLVKLD